MTHNRKHCCFGAAFACASVATPLCSQGFSTTAQLPVLRTQYEPLYTGLYAKVHAGEQVFVTASGSVCIGHVRRTERRGGFLGIGRKTVVIDHHSPVNVTARPPAFRIALSDEADQAPASQTGTAAQFVIPATKVVAARTTGLLEAFIPSADPRSHGEYAVAVSINSQGRLDLLRTALSQRGWTKSEVERDDFFSERVRQQYPEQLAEMLVAHTASQFWTGDPSERRRLLEFALTLAPTSAVVQTGLGNEYLAAGNYHQGGAVFRDALRTQRATNPKNHKSWGDAAFGLAEVYFGKGMALDPSEVAQATQLLGEAIQAYSQSPIPMRAEERKAQIRLAEVLSRTRSVEALRQAATAYARARDLVQ